MKYIIGEKDSLLDILLKFKESDFIKSIYYNYISILYLLLLEISYN